MFNTILSELFLTRREDLQLDLFDQTLDNLERCGEIDFLGAD